MLEGVARDAEVAHDGKRHLNNSKRVRELCVAYVCLGLAQAERCTHLDRVRNQTVTEIFLGISLTVSAEIAEQGVTDERAEHVIHRALLIDGRLLDLLQVHVPEESTIFLTAQRLATVDLVVVAALTQQLYTLNWHQNDHGNIDDHPLVPTHGPEGRHVRAVRLSNQQREERRESLTICQTVMHLDHEE